MAAVCSDSAEAVMVSDVISSDRFSLLQPTNDTNINTIVINTDIYLTFFFIKKHLCLDRGAAGLSIHLPFHLPKS